MDFIRTYNSIKDSKLERAKIKKVEDVVVSEDGTTIGDLLKENINLKQENLKLNDALLKSQSENIQFFNNLNNANRLLLDKVVRLENQVSTLLSINKK